jgi:site-specific recombinase XerD
MTSSPEDCHLPDYAALHERFKRHKQYLDNVSPATAEGYGWAWKAFAPVLSRHETITKNDIVEHIAVLRSGGMTPVTVNTDLRSINTFFHWLKTEGHAGDLLKIPKLKEEQKVLQTFSDGDIARLLAFKPKRAMETRMSVIVCIILVRSRFVGSIGDPAPIRRIHRN